MLPAFWTPITSPILNFMRPKKIVEIGSLYGDNSRNLLNYCKLTGAELYVIDPSPLFDVQAFIAEYGNHFRLVQNFSLNVLSTLTDYDFVLIDGDHNWYTVYHELKTIEAMARKSGKFPTVLLHDTEWPYGRRDLYYFPETIPPQYRQPYGRNGVIKGVSELVEGGFNDGACHALHEFGPRNGVLTAIEDFMKETKFPLSLYLLAPYYGLGILVPNTTVNDRFMQHLISTSGL